MVVKCATTSSSAFCRRSVPPGRRRKSIRGELVLAHAERSPREPKEPAAEFLRPRVRPREPACRARPASPRRHRKKPPRCPRSGSILSRPPISGHRLGTQERCGWSVAERALQFPGERPRLGGRGIASTTRGRPQGMIRGHHEPLTLVLVSSFGTGRGGSRSSTRGRADPATSGEEIKVSGTRAGPADRRAGRGARGRAVACRARLLGQRRAMRRSSRRSGAGRHSRRPPYLVLTARDQCCITANCRNNATHVVNAVPIVSTTRERRGARRGRGANCGSISTTSIRPAALSRQSHPEPPRRRRRRPRPERGVAPVCQMTS